MCPELYQPEIGDLVFIRVNKGFLTVLVENITYHKGEYQYTGFILTGRKFVTPDLPKKKTKAPATVTTQVLFTAVMVEDILKKNKK